MSERRLLGERLAGEITNAVLRNVDADDIVASIDVDALVARIDVDALLARVDLDALIARMDVDALVSRIDVDTLVARIDLDALVAQLDVEALARRIPVGELVGTAEIQAAVDGVDLGPALRRAGLADIVAQSVGTSAVTTVRRRVVVVDALVERLLGTVARQDIDEWPAGPEQLVGDERGPLGDLDATLDGGEAWNVTGHYVGPLGRVLASVLDVAGALSSWSLLATVSLTLLSTVFGLDVGVVDSSGEFDATGSVPLVIGLVLWFAGWFLLPLEVVGRTPAMSVLGMRVVTREGGVPGFRRILWRSIVQVPSAGLVGIGYVTTLVDRRRRALHDLVAGTSVVWDWGGRDATVASPLGRWVARG